MAENNEHVEDIISSKKSQGKHSIKSKGSKRSRCSRKKTAEQIEMNMDMEDMDEDE